MRRGPELSIPPSGWVREGDEEEVGGYLDGQLRGGDEVPERTGERVEKGAGSFLLRCNHSYSASITVH